MQLSEHQETAMRAILGWLASYRAGGEDRVKQVFVLSGYAGTGKTTLLGHLASEVDGVTFCTPTGKAMHVLRNKLQDVAKSRVRTLHNLLYTPTSGGEYRNLLNAIREAKPGTEEHAKLMDRYRKMRGDDVNFSAKEDAQDEAGDLVIVDEASMVSENVLRDLCKLNVPILLVGDDMQLPPVGGRSIFRVLGVDARLTEVHRQALDNPILRLATAIREGDQDTVDGWRRHKFRVDVAMRADRVLCYKNTTRRHLNRLLRKELGYDEEVPVAGDRLICTRNARGYQWVNGAECMAAGRAVEEHAGSTFYRLDIDYEGDMRPDTLVYVHDCVSHYRDCPELAVPWSEFPKEAQAIDYGYAITVHKAQGSEFDKVLLMDDAQWLKKKDSRQRQQWLYTAVTRAKEKLAWCE